MKIKYRAVGYLLFLVLAISVPNLSSAQIRNGEHIETADSNGNGSKDTTVAMSSSMEELLLFFEESDLIVTATKHPQLISEAPAVATIITGDEIRKSGAKNLAELLKQVPGMGISMGYLGKNVIEVRGIRSLIHSEKVKLLIDSHSVNFAMTGDAMWGYDNLSLDNVKRIEIVRGPGSALYGNNAFLAVINVITKDGKDIDGAVASAGVGSFDTYKTNLTAGKKINDLEYAFSLDYLNTRGAELTIDKDSIGNSGKTDDYDNKLEASLKLSYRDLSLNSMVVSRSKGAYLGVNNAINDETEIYFNQFFSEASYRKMLDERFTATAKLYFDHVYWKGRWEIFPEGYGPYTYGMIGVPSIKELGYGGELQTDWRISSNNILTIGVNAERRDMYHVGYDANFDPGNSFIPFPDGEMQDVSDDSRNWNQESDRDIAALYLQDMWEMTDRMNLTLGVRHDSYSDFGDSTNPRAALIWNFRDNYDLKLLYGTAFMAPTFEQLYNKNNPAVEGNPDLKPERMSTYEITIGRTIEGSDKSRFTFFFNNFTDRIQLVGQESPSQFRFENSGGAEVFGIEAETRREFGKDIYYYANYTYQWPIDKETDQRLPFVPTHKGNIGGNLALNSRLNINLNLFLSGERAREENDPRSPLSAYTVTNLTLIARDFLPDLEIRGSVYNLFDNLYEDPSALLYDTSGNPYSMSDYPREGINFMIEASYKF